MCAVVIAFFYMSLMHPRLLGKVYTENARRKGQRRTAGRARSGSVGEGIARSIDRATAACWAVSVRPELSCHLWIVLRR